VNGAFVQRVLALAGAALLAAVLALVVAQQTRSSARAAGPQPAVGAGAGWYGAVAGVAPDVPVDGKRSRCGWLLEPETLGIVHPVLPCGAKLFVELGGKRVYTEVVDRAPVASGEDFDLTAALADRVGLSGTREVRWAFARG
jgi:hypothetical protein